jgi:anti-sigma B factor antagonist
MATRAVRTVEPGITIMELTGRLNVGKNLTSVETEILALIKGGARKLILDCSTLDYIDSASIGMLIGSHEDMQKAGGTIRIAGVQGPAARTLEIIQMDRMIPLDPDLDTALRALSGA